MRRYDFIISYDIADPKRLGKIGRLMEKHAIRVQYSVYLYNDATREEVLGLVARVERIYDPEKDDIRVYKIRHHGIHLGAAVDLKNPYDFF